MGIYGKTNRCVHVLTHVRHAALFVARNVTFIADNHFKTSTVRCQTHN